MFVTTFGPVDAGGKQGGGGNVWKNSPKIRFHLFKAKLWETRLQKLIIVRRYGSCGNDEVGFDQQMAEVTPGGPQCRKKTFDYYWLNGYEI